MEAGSRSSDFVALGHPGSQHYAGLETFANPGVSQVEMTSDELAAVCPVTGQPDLYVATIVAAITSLPASKRTSTPVKTGRDSSREAERLTRAEVSSSAVRSTVNSSVASTSGRRGKSSAL